ncbi:MAG: hypothetical protein AAF549_07715 [Pseudomonadota bacterium]
MDLRIEPQLIKALREHYRSKGMSAVKTVDVLAKGPDETLSPLSKIAKDFDLEHTGRATVATVEQEDDGSLSQFKTQGVLKVTQKPKSVEQKHPYPDQDAFNLYLEIIHDPRGLYQGATDHVANRARLKKLFGSFDDEHIYDLLNRLYEYGLYDLLKNNLDNPEEQQVNELPRVLRKKMNKWEKLPENESKFDGSQKPPSEIIDQTPVAQLFGADGTHISTRTTKAPSPDTQDTPIEDDEAIAKANGNIREANPALISVLHDFNDSLESGLLSRNNEDEALAEIADNFGLQYPSFLLVADDSKQVQINRSDEIRKSLSRAIRPNENPDQDAYDLFAHLIYVNRLNTVISPLKELETPVSELRMNDIINEEKESRAQALEPYNGLALNALIDRLAGHDLLGIFKDQYRIHDGQVQTLLPRRLYTYITTWEETKAALQGRHSGPQTNMPSIPVQFKSELIEITRAGREDTVSAQFLRDGFVSLIEKYKHNDLVTEMVQVRDIIEADPDEYRDGLKLVKSLLVDSSRKMTVFFSASSLKDVGDEDRAQIARREYIKTFKNMSDEELHGILGRLEKFNLVEELKLSAADKDRSLLPATLVKRIENWQVSQISQNFDDQTDEDFTAEVTMDGGRIRLATGREPEFFETDNDIDELTAKINARIAELREEAKQEKSSRGILGEANPELLRRLKENDEAPTAGTGRTSNTLTKIIEEFGLIDNRTAFERDHISGNLSLVLKGTDGSLRANVQATRQNLYRPPASADQDAVNLFTHIIVDSRIDIIDTLAEQTKNKKEIKSLLTRKYDQLFKTADKEEIFGILDRLDRYGFTELLKRNLGKVPVAPGSKTKRPASVLPKRLNGIVQEWEDAKLARNPIYSDPAIQAKQEFFDQTGPHEILGSIVSSAKLSTDEFTNADRKVALSVEDKDGNYPVIPYLKAADILDISFELRKALVFSSLIANSSRAAAEYRLENHGRYKNADPTTQFVEEERLIQESLKTLELRNIACQIADKYGLLPALFFTSRRKDSFFESDMTDDIVRYCDQNKIDLHAQLINYSLPEIATEDDLDVATDSAPVTAPTPNPAPVNNPLPREINEADTDPLIGHDEKLIEKQDWYDAIPEHYYYSALLGRYGVSDEEFQVVNNKIKASSSGSRDRERHIANLIDRVEKSSFQDNLKAFATTYWVSGLSYYEINKLNYDQYGDPFERSYEDVLEENKGFYKKTFSTASTRNKIFKALKNHNVLADFYFFAGRPDTFIPPEARELLREWCKGKHIDLKAILVEHKVPISPSDPINSPRAGKETDEYLAFQKNVDYGQPRMERDFYDEFHMRVLTESRQRQARDEENYQNAYQEEPELDNLSNPTDPEDSPENKPEDNPALLPYPAPQEEIDQYGIPRTIVPGLLPEGAKAELTEGELTGEFEGMVQQSRRGKRNVIIQREKRNLAIEALKTNPEIDPESIHEFTHPDFDKAEGQYYTVIHAATYPDKDGKVNWTQMAVSIAKGDPTLVTKHWAICDAATGRSKISINDLRDNFLVQRIRFYENDPEGYKQNVNDVYTMRQEDVTPVMKRAVQWEKLAKRGDDLSGQVLNSYAEHIRKTRSLIRIKDKPKHELIIETGDERNDPEDPYVSLLYRTRWDRVMWALTTDGGKIPKMLEVTTEKQLALWVLDQDESLMELVNNEDLEWAFSPDEDEPDYSENDPVGQIVTTADAALAGTEKSANDPTITLDGGEYTEAQLRAALRKFEI